VAEKRTGNGVKKRELKKRKPRKLGDTFEKGFQGARRTGEGAYNSGQLNYQRRGKLGLVKSMKNRFCTRKGEGV